jgi:dethiobiotin synthetase
MTPLLLVSGTGTGIGKTHVSEALLHHWGASTRVYGFKPVETGVTGDEGEDEKRLRLASSRPREAHDPRTRRFVPPISPHLAARHAGVTLAIDDLVEPVKRLRADSSGLLVELAGGLFSPLAPGVMNAHLAKALLADGAATLLLIAPDRLGVLHDVAASTYAAAALGLTVGGIVLVAPPTPDDSTGTNAAELPTVTPVPVLATLPRAAPRSLAALPALRDVLTRALRSL